MQPLHINRSTGLANSWGWGLLWIALSLLSAQQTEDLLLLLGRDAEEVLPEEDVIILEELVKSAPRLTRATLSQIADLSFLTETDVQLLQSYSDSSSFASLFHQPQISDLLKILLKILEGENRTVNIEFDLKQMMVISKDIRYQWRGHMLINETDVGIFMERDPGENAIMDRGSGYIKNWHRHGKWILGDHQIVSGYGLLLWRSVAVKKGFESIASLPRTGRGLQPYRSSHESWNLRGAGFTWESSVGELLFSFGYNPRDGAIDSTGAIRVNDTGLHTSETAERQKRKLRESTLVGQWQFTGDRGQLGLTMMVSQWSGGERSAPRSSAGSVYWYYPVGPWTLFGEWADGYSSSKGFLIGSQYKMKNLRYLISGRSYSGRFQALRSNPFAEWTSSARNEFGLYQGLLMRFGHHKLTLYGDLYRESAITVGSEFPRRGWETAWRWEWKRANRFWRVQWKQETRTIEDNGVYLPATNLNQEQQQTLKVVNTNTYLHTFTWKLQCNLTHYQTEESTIRGVGLESLWMLKRQNYTVVLDWVTTFIKGFRARIYFWDVNLPGEMRSRMYATSGHAPGLKIIFHSRNGFIVGGRLRIIWKDLYFNETPAIEGALMIEIVS